MKTAEVTPPPEAVPGLDMFAAAWLERFTSHGGSVTVEASGEGHMFLPVDPDGAPNYRPPPADWTERQKQARREIDRWMFTGRTRELIELLDLVPGGRAAVKAHVRSFPSFAYASGTMGVV